MVRQDRSIYRDEWGQEVATLINQGVAILDQVLVLRRSRVYQVQAAIAACYGKAANAGDGPQVAKLYEAGDPR